MNFTSPSSSLVASTCIAVCFAVTMAAEARANVIHVPADHPTIQQAIDAAGSGDEIIVAPGTYHENINLLGKTITVRSSDGRDVTIIDAEFNGAGAIITCESGEGPGTLIDGFTITGALHYGAGGGMRIIGSNVTIANSRFVANEADSGSAIHSNDATLTVVECEFGPNLGGFVGAGILALSSEITVSGSNFQSLHAHSEGGAIYVTQSILSISECNFTNNSAYSGDGLGGAISARQSSVDITGSEFHNNVSKGDGDGGAIHLSGCIAVVSDCVFHGNWAVGSSFALGGAINLSGGNAVIAGCTFTENLADGGGGAIRSSWGSVEIANCTFTGNLQHAVFHFGDADPMTVSGSTFCGNSPSHIGGSWTDAGGNAFGEFCPIGDLNGDGVVDVSDLLILLGAWGACPTGGTPVSPCPGDFNGDGVVDISDLLILLANWNIESLQRSNRRGAGGIEGH